MFHAITARAKSTGNWVATFCPVGLAVWLKNARSFAMIAYFENNRSATRSKGPFDDPSTFLAIARVWMLETFLQLKSEGIAGEKDSDDPRCTDYKHSPDTSVQCFPGIWSLRGLTYEWLTRPPDLNTCDFFPLSLGLLGGKSVWTSP